MVIVISIFIMSSKYVHAFLYVCDDDDDNDVSNGMEVMSLKHISRGFKC